MKLRFIAAVAAVSLVVGIGTAAALGAQSQSLRAQYSVRNVETAFAKHGIALQTVGTYSGVVALVDHRSPHRVYIYVALAGEQVYPAPLPGTHNTHDRNLSVSWRPAAAHRVMAALHDLR